MHTNVCVCMVFKVNTVFSILLFVRFSVMCMLSRLHVCSWGVKHQPLGGVCSCLEGAVLMRARACASAQACDAVGHANAPSQLSCS